MSTGCGADGGVRCDDDGDGAKAACALPPPPALVDIADSSEEDGEAAGGSAPACSSRAGGHSGGKASAAASGQAAADVNYTDDWPNPERDEQGRTILSKADNVYVRKHLSDMLQPHQIAGVRFLYNNVIDTPAKYESTGGTGCVLAHSMGLGKTVQVITFIDVLLRSTKANSVLILVPKNTLQNWACEFDKWLPDAASLSAHWQYETDATRSFRVFVAGDSVKGIRDRHRVIAEWRRLGGVLLLGYELYRLLVNAAQHSLSGAAPAGRKRKKAANGSQVSFVDESGVEVIDVEQLDELRSMHEDIAEALQCPGPDVIVCDEGHKIKEEKSHITRALKSIKTRRRIVMTGYPLQNNLDEYYCMVDFVRPAYLGSRKDFKTMFETPILRGLCADCTGEEKRYAKLRAHVLVEKLQQFVMRRSHNLLRAILPMNREFVVLLRKSRPQRALYQAFLHYKTAGEESQGRSNAVTAFATCLKIWNHPDLTWYSVHKGAANCPPPFADIDDNDIDDVDSDTPPASACSSLVAGGEPAAYSALLQPAVATTSSTNGSRPMASHSQGNQSVSDSLAWASCVFDDIGYAPGVVDSGYKMALAIEIMRCVVKLNEKLLIFSQSLHTLSLIEEYMSRLPFEDADGKPMTWRKNVDYLRMQGTTSDKERLRLITRFNQDPRISVFLISTRAGSLGTNLTSASRVIIFDCSWNPCHDCQAICRVFRYGQSQRTYIYRLIVDNCLERVVFNRQLGKQGVFRRVVEDKDSSTTVNKSELDDLLQYDPAKDEDPPDVVPSAAAARRDAQAAASEETESLDDPLLEELYTHSGHYFECRPQLMDNLMSDVDGTLTEEEKREAKRMFHRDTMELSRFGDVDYSGDSLWRRTNRTDLNPPPMRRNPYSFTPGYDFSPYEARMRCPSVAFVPDNMPTTGFNAGQFAVVGAGYGPGMQLPRPMPVLRRAGVAGPSGGHQAVAPQLPPASRLILTDCECELMSMTFPGQRRRVLAKQRAMLYLARHSGMTYLQLVDEPHREFLNARGTPYEALARRIFAHELRYDQAAAASPLPTGATVSHRGRPQRHIETVTLDSDSD